ncbi:rRNA maturation RNase YbeY [Desulfonatronovibrio hydrogenovorans]|uniref:rRNA maturation RNase YbeY n=1 Tax=Desulfonatronovibrio hydrogenovorans TaxID=53245 RepID=UPI00068B999F|nr:rRNA maturation RNase YbeY [Desulfonatronovibrio hydrogenovorans]
MNDPGRRSSRISVRFEAGLSRVVVTSPREIRTMAHRICSGPGLDEIRLEMLFTDDPGMAGFNKKFLDLKGPTNVLSFPGDSPADPAQLIINIDGIERESFLYGQDPYSYLVRLMVHGILHLAGFEHGPLMDATSSEIISQLDNYEENRKK